MATKNTATTVIELPKNKDCKSCVRFDSPDPEAVITNVYVSRKLAGLDKAKAVRLTIEVVN